MIRTSLAITALLTVLLQGCATTSGTSKSSAHAFDYVCEGGQHVHAVYLDDHARIDYAGKTYTLDHAISADGARYVGSDLQWWTRGNGAVLSDLASAKPLLSHCHTQLGGG